MAHDDAPEPLFHEEGWQSVRVPGGGTRARIRRSAMTERGKSDPEHDWPSVREVADLVGGRWQGDGAARVRRLRPLEQAGPNELGLLSSRRYARFAADCTAGAILVTTELADALPDHATRIVVDDPRAAVAAVLERLHPEGEPFLPEIHPTAVFGTGVRLGEGVAVGAYAVLGDGVHVGDDTRIEAHVVVGTKATLGTGCHIHPQVVVYPGVEIGDRVVVHSGTRIGSDGFGYTFREGAHHKVPQVGGCVIGDDVEIGANTTIDRGSIGDTVIGSGVKIDNLVQIAHNVTLGPHSLAAALVGIAGSTRIGSGVWLGGQSGLIGHLDVGDGARVAVATKVFRDIPAEETVSGHPARPHRQELRRQAHLGRLPKLNARVEALEAEIRSLRKEQEGEVGSGEVGEEDNP
jgi:UDP-3-O-[3-hydroxymyristoyl] glucosamine N-acyltransferase